MAISLSPATTVTTTTENLLGRLPEGSFYLKAPTILPNYYEPIPFQLQVDTVPSDVTVTVVYKSQERPTSRARVTIRPTDTSSIIYLQLYQGLNRVHAQSVDGITEMLIACTNYATILFALGDELYDYAQVPYENLRRDLENPFGSRMVEHLLLYQDMLPPVQSLRTIGARLTVKASIAMPGTPTAPTEFLKGLLSNTPEVVSSLETERSLLPSLFYLRKESEAFGGSDFHIWVPNVCSNLWSTATIFWDRTSPHAFKKVSETEVVVTESGVDSQHRFPDPLGGGCSSLLPDECTNFGMLGWLDREMFGMIFFADPIWFDTVIEPCFALGRSTYDCEDIYDNGVLYDSIDDFDPTGDGWVGFPITRRLDHPSCLDTSLIDIAEITECNSHFPVTPLENTYQETDVDMTISSFGEVVCAGGTCTF